jgi:hypothetical protein
VIAEPGSRSGQLTRHGHEFEAGVTNANQVLKQTPTFQVGESPNVLAPVGEHIESDETRRHRRLVGRHTLLQCSKVHLAADYHDKLAIEHRALRQVISDSLRDITEPLSQWAFVPRLQDSDRPLSPQRHTAETVKLRLVCVPVVFWELRRTPGHHDRDWIADRHSSTVNRTPRYN